MSRALEGIRVVDLTRVIAGPFATAMLGDLGADILKIELPGRGDDGRYGYPLVEGVPVAFKALNRNKRGITLDVRKPRGAELLRRLARDADIVVENFSAGTMDKWGLGYSSLSEINPQLIYAALSGFGQTGPYKDRTSYDIIAQAIGGLMAITGSKDGPPIRGGGSLGDFIGGVFLTVGILAALHHRERSGEGQLVDISNMDAVASVTDNLATVLAMTGSIPARNGNRHPYTAPYDCYQAKDGYLVIGVGNSQLFRSLMTAMGREELGRDPRYKSPAARLERHDEVNELVADWVRARTVAEVMQALGPEGANVPCAPVMSVGGLLTDPQMQARHMVVELADTKLGKVPVMGSPFKLSKAEPEIRFLGPDLGQHNKEVYCGELGLTEAELVELTADGVV